MDDNLSKMETSDDLKTLTSSQEDKLLADDPRVVNSNAAGLPKEVQRTVALRPATLTDIRRTLESNDASQRSEMSVSLQTGVVTVERPTPHLARTRSKEQKLAAKRKSRSLVNPHERIKQTVADQSPKRQRDIGGTPPSATQPSKKIMTGEISDSIAAAAAKSKKQEKNREKNRKRKEKIKLKKVQNNLNSIQSTSNAGTAAESDKSVPPQPKGDELSGSNLSNEAGGSQQNAESSGDTASKQNPTPMDSDGNTVTQSYAQVADGRCVAIIDQRKPDSMLMLDQSRFDKLNAHLTDIIVSMIGKNAELPVFDDTRLHMGAMRIRCANNYTRKWLELNIPKVDVKKLWSGAKLVVIDFRDLPKPHKFNVFFRGILKSPKDIFKLLETQNKGIITKSWTVLSCKQKDGGTQMTIGVGQDSFDILRTQSNSLYCGMNRAQFTVVKSCKENKVVTQNAAAPKSSAATNVASSNIVPNQQQQVIGDPIMAAVEKDNVTNATDDRMEE